MGDDLQGSRGLAFVIDEVGLRQIVGDAGRVRQELLDRDDTPGSRTLGDVSADEVGDLELALNLEQQDGRSRELLGVGADKKPGLRAVGGLLVAVGKAVALLRSTCPCWAISTEPLNSDCEVMLASMASTAEMASGEMAVDDGELPIEGATLVAEEAELGVTFGGAAGEQAETIRKIPQIASSAR